VISVVVPLFNESETVEIFVTALQSTLRRVAGDEYEVVLVDDGSTDDTWDKIRGWHERDEHIQGVMLSRNFGHQAAVTAGLELTRGDVVVVMDGDMQDDPEAIPLFLERHREGYDVVYAVRTGRSEARWMRIGYWLHYRLGARIADVVLPLDAGDFGLMTRQVVDELNALPESIRYVRGLRAWVGFRQTGVPVARRERVAGESKYTLRRLTRLSVDGLLGFSVTPLRLSVLLGGVVLVGAIGYGAVVLVDRLITGDPPAGFAALALLILVLNGTVLIVLGIVGEYVGRIYLEVKARPGYVVKDRLTRDTHG
jgi:polyisoprenyl-phosphate glycosyltransferase